MTFASIDPTTGQQVAAFPTMTTAESDTVVARADTAQRLWAALSFAERARPMRAVAALLMQRKDVFAQLMALEMGKPLRDGTAEIAKCASACEYFAEHAEKLLRPRHEPSDANTSYVRFDPLGVILAIMPWNFPFWQVFRFIAPHLMAGNGGMLKHAPNVPQCALAITTVMNDAGFPPGLFGNLMIGTDAIRQIIDDPRVAAVTITGSERAGRTVAEMAGRALKPIVLELGGTDPFIVLADADIDTAAMVACTARLMNTGQSCICAKRFIVQAPAYDRFLARLTEAMRMVRVGDPNDPATNIGPMARSDLRDGLHAQVDDAVAAGARLVLGGRIPAGAGFFYPPTILADVAADNPAANEELFGPVATVMRVTSVEHAITLANATRFGLGASLWTSDLARGEILAVRIAAGAVFINGQVKSDPRLPFGGIRASGFGRELGQEGIRSFVNAKTVWIK